MSSRKRLRAIVCAPACREVDRAGLLQQLTAMLRQNGAQMVASRFDFEAFAG